MNEVNIDDLALGLRTVIGRLIKKLRKESATGSQMSLTARSTLALLENGPLLPSELAAMEKITNQSMSQILKDLLELGYIRRTPSETDKRKVLISLSAEGEKILLQIRSERVEWLSHAIQATCTPLEQDLLQKALTPLTKLVDFE